MSEEIFFVYRYLKKKNYIKKKKKNADADAGPLLIIEEKNYMEKPTVKENFIQKKTTTTTSKC
jgi:hypothetical protein